MKTIELIPTFGASFLLAAGLITAAQPAFADTTTACRQTIATDLKAISADLSAIASQANAQGFNAAVEQFATDMEAIVPTLNRPSQEAVQKFVTDLETATSASSPGGTAITAAERLMLTNDWANLVTSAGLTSAEIATISNDLTSVLSTVKGISTAKLQSDFSVLVADLESCGEKR